MVIVNSTQVAPKEEVNYFIYWASMFTSTVPYFRAQAEFIKQGMKVSAWEVGLFQTADGSAVDTQTW